MSVSNIPSVGAATGSRRSTMSRRVPKPRRPWRDSSSRRRFSRANSSESRRKADSAAASTTAGSATTAPRSIKVLATPVTRSVPSHPASPGVSSLLRCSTMPSGTSLRPEVVVSSTMPPGSSPSRRHSPAAERCEIADDGPAHSWAALSLCSHELGAPCNR